MTGRRQGKGRSGNALARAEGNAKVAWRQRHPEGRARVGPREQARLSKGCPRDSGRERAVPCNSASSASSANNPHNHAPSRFQCESSHRIAVIVEEFRSSLDLGGGSRTTCRSLFLCQLNRQRVSSLGDCVDLSHAREKGCSDGRARHCLCESRFLLRLGPSLASLSTS